MAAAAEGLALARACPGTGLRDASVALVASTALTSVLVTALGLGPAALTLTLPVAAAFLLVGLAGWSVARRPGRWCGAGDRVTLARSVLVGGCASVAVGILDRDLPPRPWALVALLLPALLLDLADGWAARRTGTASAAGATLDMELDAALLLVVSLAAAPTLGWWVVAIGGMRYAYAVAARLRPVLGRPVPSSRFRRAVAGAQGTALLLAMIPLVPTAVGRVLVAGALALLVVSFASQALWTQRHSRSPSRVATDAVPLRASRSRTRSSSA